MLLRWKLSISLAIALLASALPAFPAQAAVELRTDGGPVELAPYMQVLEDPSRALGVDELASGARAAAFKPNLAPNSSYGYSRSAYWVRFRLANRSEATKACVLELDYLWFDEATLFTPGEDGTWRSATVSYDRPWAARAVKSPSLAFPVELPPGSERSYYLRLAGEDIMRLSATLYPYMAYIARESEHMVIWGLIFGVLAIMTLYHLSLGSFLRDSSYLLFAAYIFFATVHLLQHHGLYYLWLPPWLEFLREGTYYFWSSANNLFGVLFFVSFLSIRKNFPRLFPLAIVLIALSALQSIATPFLPTQGRDAIDRVVAMLIPICGLPVLLYSAWTTKTGRYYLLSFMPLALGPILGWVFDRTIPGYDWSAADFYRRDIELLLSVVAMSVSLAARYSDIRRERDSAAAYNLAQTNFFINLSHEIKTPLMLIASAFDDFLAGRGDEGSLRIAKRNVDRLVDDISSFFDVLRHERGLPIYRHDRVVDLSALLEDKAGIFGAFAAKRGLGMESAVEPGLAVAVDPLAIERIVNNLLDNAAKYCPAGGTVRIEAAAKDGRIELAVSNESAGYSAAELSRLFDPYFQAPRHRGSAQGVGLGLSLVKAVAESFGGSALAAMKGGRLEIRLALPAAASGAGDRPRRPAIAAAVAAPGAHEGAAAAPAAASPAAPEVYAGEGGRKILLVEDDDELRELLARRLRQEYEVVAVASAEEALRSLGGGDLPEVLVSDIMLPRMDGIELAKALATDDKLRDIPVVLMTARTGIEEKLRALSLGAVDCIFKPFRIDELLYRVAGLVKLRDLQRELRGAERLASLGLLSGAICHEVLNPLSIVQGSLENASALIREGGPGYLERVPAFLGYAKQSAARIERTVRALRTSFAEGEAPTREELELRSLLYPLAEEARRSASAGIKIGIDCPEALHIRTDGVAFSTAIACLVDNAVKSLQGGTGLLRIEGSEGASGPEILIEDTGCGMRPERLRAIRERISAGSGSEGMGFGILLAGELLGRLGYRLEFESEIGEGTRVRVSPDRAQEGE